ncbi:MAG: signal peptidase II [Parvularculaceae bacterium]
MNVQAMIDRGLAWSRHARASRLFWFGLAGAALVIAADQASKYWIVHIIDLPSLGKIEISKIFDLSYVENKGASFGMLHGMRWVLSAISTVVALALVWWLGEAKRPLPAAAIAFLIGGALGNLFDRLAYGYVVDFLDFSGLWFPWVFNVADSAINIGIALILFDAWRSGKAAPGGK